MKKRIWELDAFRGICILGMVVVHLLYDLTELYRIVQWNPPDIYDFVKSWGGLLFLILSGLCATLGSKSVRRGLVVLGAGMIVSLVTYGMYHFGFAGKSIIIYFGVLHCLGICMILWPIFRKLPWYVLLILGVILVAVGFHFKTITVESQYLFPFGLLYRGFSSSDYFPLLPNLGYFLLGGALGKTLYRKKESLLPALEGNILLRPLCFLGRHSLWVYLLHQPILSGICMLLAQK